ncbi:DUF1223 domain-containing protein [Cellulophaga sp. HaHaR_3_176]|uniref:DUF1223 domain-containing protein n=1 Tax=Cellulophaga sp. HaHaR_3_176 TaxID=1942464 RepID=UPI001C1F5BD2|nr:DUF1223 domain-containing protein [Cellulophaga sp. HaHaR_3_176]QWX84773.1 DUF1223 domain-containing protein [Cellulophaga sp. HaHaR_3_176]
MKNKGIIFALLLISLLIMSFKFDSYSSKKGARTLNSEENKGVVVLELYTSQGCSSCPSADALLEKVKKQYSKEVIPLSYHVDYWNYIGWKDPFSKAVYTEKQTAYNYKFKNRSNYTPQVVVNGATHFVGSNSSEMYSNINTFKSKKIDNDVTFSNVKVSSGFVKFNYEIKGDLSLKKMRVVLVLDKRSTEVKRGENRNRTLINSNIVVAEKYIKPNAKGGETIQIPSIVNANEKISILLIVENDNFDITGATKASLVKE